MAVAGAAAVTTGSIAIVVFQHKHSKEQQNLTTDDHCEAKASFDTILNIGNNVTLFYEQDESEDLLLEFNNTEEYFYHIGDLMRGQLPHGWHMTFGSFDNLGTAVRVIAGDPKTKGSWQAVGSAVTGGCVKAAAVVTAV